MANIQKITEFKAGREALSETHYTVYYDTGRRVNYYGRDNLPMTVVTFLTDENTVSETVYIEDDYLHCVNSRTTYTHAPKPTEAPETADAAEQDEQTTATVEAAQDATQDAEKPIKDFKDNWRDSRIFYLKCKYGKRFEEWKDKDYHDDRIVYCNIYRLQLEALESLPADPLNYICVAMNHHMKEDRETLDSIIENFKGR